MPELPEVETVRRTLCDKLVGNRVVRVEILTPRQIWYPDPDSFRAEVEGAAFTNIGRRGKYLLLQLGPLTLVCHLRMSGHLFVCGPERSRGKHVHLIYHLQDGMELRYEDQRKFGGFHLLGLAGEGMPSGLKNLGPEPLSAEFTPGILRSGLAGRGTSIKAALLQQSLVAGLGNIYVDEALFSARLHPMRTAGSLTVEETERLHHCIQEVLTKAIEKRGTTFSLYLDGEGKAGEMYEELQVFDQTGKPCPHCGTPILKLAVAGRGTHLCPDCQTAPPDVHLKSRGARTGRRGDRVSVAAEPPAERYTTRKAKGD